MTVPKLLDEESERLLKQVERAYDEAKGTELALLLPAELGEMMQLRIVGGEREGPSISRAGDWIGFAGITGSRSRSPEVDGWTIEEEMTECFRQLTRASPPPPSPSSSPVQTRTDASLRPPVLLTPYSSHSPLLSITHLTLYLTPQTLPLFSRLNAVYSSFFGTAPPTRACVAVLLPPSPSGSSPRIVLEGIAFVDPHAGAGTGTGGSRKSLHVQSISYWAAANIGPYSQTISVRSLLPPLPPLPPSAPSFPPVLTPTPPFPPKSIQHAPTSQDKSPSSPRLSHSPVVRHIVSVWKLCCRCSM